MHESSLMKGLMHKLEQIAAREGAKRIAVVRVRLGALSHFSEPHFRDHFVEAATGGVAERAALEIEMGTDPREPKAQEVWLQSVDLEWDPEAVAEVDGANAAPVDSRGPGV